jgi:hypothetical protein
MWNPTAVNDGKLHVRFSASRDVMAAVLGRSSSRHRAYLARQRGLRFTVAFGRLMRAARGPIASVPRIPRGGIAWHGMAWRGCARTA